MTMKSIKLLLPLLFAALVVLNVSSTAQGRRVFAKKYARVQKSLGANMRSFSDSLSAVTGKLHAGAVESAARNGDENVVISPFSISVSLGMSLLGARDNTAFEIERFTEWQWPEGSGMDVHNLMRKMIKKISNPGKESEVNMSNAMFLDNGFKVDPDYKGNIIEKYLAQHESLDFAGDSVGAAKHINDWITDETGLEEVIPDGAIDSLTKMVLVNVVNFLGKWNVRFNPKTKTLPFKPDFNDATAIPVEFLVKDELPILFYQNPNLPNGINAMFFAIPYKALSTDGVTSYMVIGVPETAEDLRLINEGLGGILAEMKPIRKTYGTARWNNHNVDVKIPKFDVSHDVNVKEVLVNQRVTELFDAKDCDLSGITKTEDNGLYVSDFLHKARVAIDAEGTEAAAATTQMIAFRSMPRAPPPPITVDVPFFFGIYNSMINTFVFTGVISNPNAKN